MRIYCIKCLQVCINIRILSNINNTVTYINYTQIGVWLLPDVQPNIIDQCIHACAFYYTYACHYKCINNALLHIQNSKYLYHYIPFLLMSMLLFACLLLATDYASKSVPMCAHGWSLSFWQMPYTQWHYRFLRIALVIYDADIIYFHMDTAQLVFWVKTILHILIIW